MLVAGHASSRPAAFWCFTDLFVAYAGVLPRWHDCRGPQGYGTPGLARRHNPKVLIHYGLKLFFGQRLVQHTRHGQLLHAL